MALPRVFISSTCYDLKYIRENLKFFIGTVGYQPVLSEDSDALYNPNQHTHGAIIGGVESCQLFILVIGGRSGLKKKDGAKSIVNKEYEAAIANKIPVYALIEREVYAEHFVYLKSKDNQQLKYPSVDDVRIFDFIDQVKKDVTFNSIMPFNDFTDVESFLKTQWAEMMYYFLMNHAEFRKINNLLQHIAFSTEKVEFYTKKLAESSPDKSFKLDVELYDITSDSFLYRDILKMYDYRLTPADILKHKSINNLLEVEKKGREVYLVAFKNKKLAFDYKIFDEMKNTFSIVKKELENALKKHNVSVDTYLNEIEK